MENFDQQSWETCGSYRLLHLLGQGENTRVYLATHVAHTTHVALKIWNIRLSLKDQEHFLNETRILTALRHPGIVPLLETGITANRPFMVMEYASGGTLLLRHPDGTRVAPTQILAYIRPIGAALHAMHQHGVLHRNLKPENLLVSARNEILVSDFALALGTQSSCSRQMDVLASHANYLAPELLQGCPVPASDQYALAMIIYAWLSGSLPFRGTYAEVVSQQLETLPPPLPPSCAGTELAWVVMTALAKNPRQRFQSLPAFVRALEQAIGGPTAFSVTEKHSDESRTQLTLMAPTITHQFSNEIPPAKAAAVPDPYRTAVYDNPLPLSAKTLAVAPLPSTPRLPAASSRQKATRNFWLVVALYLLTLVELGIGADLRILQPAIIQQQHVLATSTADESTRIAAQATNTAIVEQSPNFLFASLAQRTPLLALNDAQDYKNWRSSTPTNQYCAFQHGAYTAQIDQQVNSAGNFYTFCADADQQTANLHNFAYQADLTIQRGDEGGLIFRDSSTTKSLPQLFYMYTVNEAGTYGLSVAEAQVQVLWYQPTNVIKKGVGQTNILTVIAYNNWIYLFINSHYLAGIYDNSSSAGTIGVVAVGGSNATIAAFTHVRVWTL